MELLDFYSKHLRNSYRSRMLHNRDRHNEITNRVMRKNIHNRMKKANALIDVLIVSNVVLWLVGLVMLVNYS